MSGQYLSLNQPWVSDNAILEGYKEDKNRQDGTLK
jgi:hypothetical protein